LLNEKLAMRGAIDLSVTLRAQNDAHNPSHVETPRTSASALNPR
jgi:hypothetical protein